MQIGPRIRFDSHTLANLAKNVSPALAFTPVGLAGTAALAAAGEYGRGHHSFSDLAKAAGSNVAIGAGARGVAGHFGVLGQGGPAAPAELGGPHVTPTAGPTPAPISSVGDLTHTEPSLTGQINSLYGHGGAYDAVAPTVGNTVTQAGEVASSVAPGSSGPGFFSRLATGALNHDKLTSNALSAAGSLVGSGARNRQTDAQTQLLELEAEQRRQDLERQKQSAQLDPLRAGIYKQIFSNLGTPQPTVTG